MTFDDIFDKLGGPAKVGRRIGVTTEHAAAMRRRGSVPARYWPTLLAGSDIPTLGITYETLATAAAAGRPLGAAA